MKRFLLAPIFLLTFAAPSFATQITVGSSQWPNYRYAGSTATLRIYYSQSFLSSENVNVVGSAVGGNGWFAQVACTIDGLKNLNCASFTVYSTIDSNKPNTRFFAVLYDQSGARRETLMGDASGWIVPASPTTTTVAQLLNSQGTGIVNPPTLFLNDRQVQAKIDTAVGTLNDASTTVKGRTKLSVAPVLSSNPIAVGDNDPRVTAIRRTLPYLFDGSFIVGKFVRMNGVNVEAIPADDSGGGIGIVTSGASGSVVVQLAGAYSGAILDGSASVGDYLQSSTSVPGAGHSVGAAYPTSGQVLGRVIGLSPTVVDIFGTEVRAGGGSSFASIVNVTQAPYNADNTGATDASAAIEAAITAGAKRIYLPAGTYLISQAQLTAHATIFALTSDGVEFFGDGQGLTIVTVPPSITVNPSDSVIVRLTGKGQSVHDITWQGPTAVTGAEGLIVIEPYVDCYGPKIYNNEIVGWNNNKTAGAAGIHLGANWNDAQITTALGTVIVAGTRTVTPASMTGIYSGRILTIGGTSEYVTVTAVTQTTFTAVFANAHGASDSVVGVGNMYQGATVRDNYIHDCPKATAVVVGTYGNRFLNNRVERVGVTTSQHAFYVQAGRNLFQGNYVNGISGYGIHQYSTGSFTIDSSGNRYTDNEFVNAPVIVQLQNDEVSDGTNPYLPSGVGLDRYISFSHNTFRATGGFVSSFQFLGNTPVDIDFSYNVIEDCYYFFSRTSPNSRISNNILRWVSAPVDVNGAITMVGDFLGGGEAWGDFIPEWRSLKGQAAYPQGTTNITGGDLNLAAGIGRKKFTAVSNTAGAVTVTIANYGLTLYLRSAPIMSVGGANNFVSGVDFALGSDNTAPQLAVTATNLAAAINASIYHQVRAVAVGADIFISANYGILTLSLSTNQSGRISVTNSADGVIRSSHDLAFRDSTIGPVVKSPDGLTCKRVGIDNAGALTLTTVTCP